MGLHWLQALLCHRLMQWLCSLMRVGRRHHLRQAPLSPLLLPLALALLGHLPRYRFTRRSGRGQASPCRRTSAHTEGRPAFRALRAHRDHQGRLVRQGTLAPRAVCTGDPRALQVIVAPMVPSGLLDRRVLWETRAFLAQPGMERGKATR